VRTPALALLVCGTLTALIAAAFAAESRPPATPAAGPAAAESKVAEYVYKKAPQGELKMFVHFPRDWKASDKRPAIVFFFGGAWRQGSPEQFRMQAEYLATRGFVAARPDYRVASRHKTTPDAAVEDARSAVRWLRERAAELGIDRDRLVGAGGSAGGHLAACAALCDTPDAPGEDTSVSCRPSALVLFNPVVDLRNLDLQGWKAAEAPGSTLVEQLSPVVHMTRSLPPTILFYGTEDKFLAQGRAMLAKAKELACRAELYTAAGMPHGFFNRPPWQEITLRQADAFLASLGYLKGEPTIPPPAGTALSLKKEP